MKTFNKSSHSIKNKMKQEDPDSGRLGKKYDNRNDNNICIRNSRRYISDALLSIRWKTAGPTCILNDDFNNFVKLLYN
jgi:hypothetical protein